MTEREHTITASILTAGMLAAFAFGALCGAVWVMTQAGV